MDFDYREEELAVAELARKILEDQATNERLKSLGAAGTPLDDALYRALADSNLLGTAIPEAHGGSDLGF
ncbi:MAG: acyl-CoA dehydrogenase, partial [Myxococcales bacterium]|nr:acyl-CoA dehydrogenase [Myxococcales bacterium]